VRATVTGAVGNQVPEQFLVKTTTGQYELELLGRSSLNGGAAILRDDEVRELTVCCYVSCAPAIPLRGTANAMDVEIRADRAAQIP